MTAPVEIRAGHRTRTRTEIDRDVLSACRRLGELAMVAEIGLCAPDHAEISATCEGLRCALIEHRAGGHE